MNTFLQFSMTPPKIPLQTVWLLTDLAESIGKQALFTHQAPQRLKALREHAIIESAVSSNRIEGVTVEPSRLKTVLFGKNLLHDRDEEEVRGYRKALDWIHSKGKSIPIEEETILKLHRMTRPEAGDAGKYKEKPGDIIEKYPDGRERIRFKTVSPKETPKMVARLIREWGDANDSESVPELIRCAAFCHDFLCIHPFRDGNGRVSRLLFLLQTYHFGLEVGRYISLERIIEQNKSHYYEALEKSSHAWHQAKHDSWPIINHLLATLRTAYKEFEERVGEIKGARGSKKDLILTAIEQSEGSFSVSDLRSKCPGVSVDMIRRVLKDLQQTKNVRCTGMGQKAKWEKIKGSR